MATPLGRVTARLYACADTTHAYATGRRTHTGRVVFLQRSNMYFVARLKPTGSTEIRMDTAELSDCIWMPLSDYIAM